MVYFGASVADLSDGGQAEEVNQLAMSDHHRFDGKTGFSHNTDPECRRIFGLDPEKNYVGFFNGEESKEKFV